jgi:hypothetical protein
MELSIKLRKEGIITTPGAPFEASWNQEINVIIIIIIIDHLP